MQVYRGWAGRSGDVHQLLFAIIIYCVAESIISGRFFNVVSVRQHVNAIVCACVHKTKGLLINNSGGGEDALAEYGGGNSGEGGMETVKIKRVTVADGTCPVLSPTRPTDRRPLCVRTPLETVTTLRWPPGSSARRDRF